MQTTPRSADIYVRLVARASSDDGATLKDHIERRHPKEDVRWWVVAEEPDVLPFER